MIYKCRMCGANIEICGNEKIVTCAFCDTIQTIPNVDEEKTLEIYNRASYYLSINEYDKASNLYEKIIIENANQAEAYWGLCLARYGVEYVFDEKKNKRVPTCHRTLVKSILLDEDYKKALSLADSVARDVYQNEANYIDKVQKKILEIADKGEKYDIFICYKESNNNERTIDSRIAEELYDVLSKENYKVFFSRISLEDKIGEEYEPYIYSALRSAKIMIVVCTNKEYVNSTWVKNEWSRFLNMKKDSVDKILIPCYKNISPYDLPDDFINLQCLDLNRLGATKDLIRGIKKILGGAIQNQLNEKENIFVADKVANCELAISRGLYDEAEVIANEIVSLYPNNPYGYLMRFCVDNQINSKCLDDFWVVHSREKDIYFLDDFKKAVHFGNDELKAKLLNFEKQRKEAKERKKIDKALELKKENKSIDDIKIAIQLLESCKGDFGQEKILKECKDMLNYKTEYEFMSESVFDLISSWATKEEKRKLYGCFCYLKKNYQTNEFDEYINSFDRFDDTKEKNIINSIEKLKKELDEFYSSDSYCDIVNDYQTKKKILLNEIDNLKIEKKNVDDLFDQKKKEFRDSILKKTEELKKCGIFQIKQKKGLLAEIEGLNQKYNEFKKVGPIYIKDYDKETACRNDDLSLLKEHFKVKINDLKSINEIPLKENNIDELKLSLENLKKEKTMPNPWQNPTFIKIQDNLGYKIIFVKLGKYPQRKVDSLELIEKLNNVCPINNIISLNGLDYAKYENEYFLVEPIIWRVVNFKKINGKRVLLLLSDYSLDYKNIVDYTNMKLIKHDNSYFEYINKKNGRPFADYSESDIRSWLNKEFFEFAFNENEKKMILDAKIDNSCSSTGLKENNFACSDTIDKVFLLSYRAS